MDTPEQQAARLEKRASVSEEVEAKYRRASPEEADDMVRRAADLRAGAAAIRRVAELEAERASVLADVLVLLSGFGQPTPERGYVADGGWSLALGDVRRCIDAWKARAEAAEKAIKPASIKSRLLGVCDGFQAGASAEVKAIEAELGTVSAEAARLREAVDVLLRSAVPHPVEHPTMTEAWAVGDAALTNTHATANWLAALKAEVRRAALEEATSVLRDRLGREEYGHAKAAVALDLKEIEALIEEEPKP